MTGKWGSVDNQEWDGLLMITRDEESVARVMRPIFWPLRECSTRGRETSTRGMPQHLENSLQHQNPGERMSSCSHDTSPKSREGRYGSLVEDLIGITPTSVPQSTSGRALLPDIWMQNIQRPRSTGRPIPGSISPVPPWILELGSVHHHGLRSSSGFPPRRWAELVVESFWVHSGWPWVVIEVWLVPQILKPRVDSQGDEPVQIFR